MAFDFDSGGETGMTPSVSLGMCVPPSFNTMSAQYPFLKHLAACKISKLPVPLCSTSSAAVVKTSLSLPCIASFLNRLFYVSIICKHVFFHPFPSISISNMSSERNGNCKAFIHVLSKTHSFSLFAFGQRAFHPLSFFRKTQLLLNVC